MKFHRLSLAIRTGLVISFIESKPAALAARDLSINRNTVNTWYTLLRDRVSSMSVVQPKDKKAFLAYHKRRTALLMGVAQHKELDHLSESRARYVLRKGFRRAVLALAKDLLD